MVSADNLNLDVLELICDFLSGNDLPSVAAVSQSFLAAVIPRLYRTISYRLVHSKEYAAGEQKSPFTAVLAHPHRAIHVRNIEIRSVPTIKSRPHPGFIHQCRDALQLCKNLTTFRCTAPNVLPTLLLPLQEKLFLRDMRLHAHLSTPQAQMLMKIKGLTNLTVEFASWNVVHMLPAWVQSLSSTLSSLTLYMINDLNEDIFKVILSRLPNLRELHVVGCPKIDHVLVFRHVAQTPLLEHLSLTTSESAKSLMLPPPSLRFLKHLALDTRYTMQPSPSPNILTSILAHLKPSAPPLHSFTIKLPDRKVIIGEQFINQLLGDYGHTLRRLSFLDCGIGQESIEAICKGCSHLERLDVSIPVRELAPFTRRISLSSTLHTIVDVDNHVDHGIRPTLNVDNARYMMSLSGSLRKIVTTHRIWTGRIQPHGGLSVKLERRSPHSSGSLWFTLKD